MNFQRQPGAGHAECGVVGHPLALDQSQKTMQRQRVGAAPLDLALRIQALELADKQHPEVPARRDRQAALVLVAGLAEHLDRLVELRLSQDLVAPVIEIMPGCQLHGQHATSADRPSSTAQSPHCQGADTPSHIPDGNKVIHVPLFNGLIGRARAGAPPCMAAITTWTGSARTAANLPNAAPLSPPTSPMIYGAARNVPVIQMCRTFGASIW